jgi:hypothetical protein
MSLFRWLIGAASIMLVGGTFLVFYTTLLSTTEIAVKLWRRIFLSWADKRLRDMGILQEKPFQYQAELDWKRLVLLGVTGLLMLAVRDLMLSPLVFLIGLTILAWLNFQQKQIEHAQVNEDAEAVALQIRALMTVDHSILNALKAVRLSDGTMKKAIEQVANRLQMHQTPDQAAQSLKGLPGKVTSRLAALIANNSQLTDDIQDELLQSLEQEAHRQKLLRSKTSQTLSLVRGTIRLLQAAVACAVGFVMLYPAWRDFFLQDVSHRVLLAVTIGVVVLSSFYFEFEVYQLSYGEV